jgi:hypothetical protein
MTKTDPALDTIRKVRRQISRDFEHDPVRLIEHYVELQRRMDTSKLVGGPDDDLDESNVARDAAQLTP